MKALFLSVEHGKWACERNTFETWPRYGFVIAPMRGHIRSIVTTATAQANSEKS
ncbi:hypothetical protein [Schlesneria paludicola]|uniref:hypothetical protein n=1 Tax=Schlesneria paludicola TaxID=360056 RepID=UPI0002D96D7D|nr:hypothetical protein [Schlesneria paludicola]